jgi:putative nucleotidyltransferase with HDIG domain
MLSHRPPPVPAGIVIDLPPRAWDLLARMEERGLADHGHQVARLAAGVCAFMGVEDAQATDVVRAALLHDVGKLRIPQPVIDRPGTLTPEQWTVVRRHPVHGERMVSGLSGLERLAPVIRAHHERWDGGGYPDGLAGEEIPLGARIVFVCDAFDAITSARRYSPARTLAYAVGELRRGAGTQFDPVAAAALAAHVHPEPGYARRVPAP